MKRQNKNPVRREKISQVMTFNLRKVKNNLLLNQQFSK